MWTDSLKHIKSKGSTQKKIGRLAQLHAARESHKGQFFTPDDVALVMHEIAQSFLPSNPTRRIRLLDNSVGAGRLLQYATPEKFALYGIDIDDACVTELRQSAELAGFAASFMLCGLEDAAVDGMDIALINPAFSLNLHSPFLTSCAFTRHGPLGPNTSALSHEYATYQAVMAAKRTVALLPWPMAQNAQHLPEIGQYVRAIIKLPNNAFHAENAAVSTGLVVFARDALKKQHTNAPVFAFSEWANAKNLLPVMDLEYPPAVTFTWNSVTADEPKILTPFTGDKTVRVFRCGKRVKLSFACGAQEAITMNRVLGDTLSSHRNADGTYHRYPKQIKYMHDGCFFLEAHLAHEAPLQSFASFISKIESTGARPTVDFAVYAYLKRRSRELKIQATPFRHWVYERNAISRSNVITVEAKETFSSNVTVFGSSVFRKGERYELTRHAEGPFEGLVNGRKVIISENVVRARFIDKTPMPEGWRERATGRVHAFPALAKAYEEKARALGIHKWFDRPYQWHDLIEMCLTPGGLICGWDMACGKARGSIALNLMGGKYNLICVQAGLVPEMLKELAELPIESTEWQCIDSPQKLHSLRKINIISYERLRMNVKAIDEDVKLSRGKTYSHYLRNRISTLVADEGDCVRNLDTQQTQALYRVNAQKRIILTGSPISNYPRDVHPQLVFALGDGVAHQPYSWHGPFISSDLTKHAMLHPRGIDQFREDFIVTEWVTNEFLEDNRTGAKREVPKIANLAKFRNLMATSVKRRLISEPEVLPYLNIPEGVTTITPIKWDAAHLAHFIEVAERFATLYRDWCWRAGQTGKGINLISLLARIGALDIATNYPQYVSQNEHDIRARLPYKGSLTSKQRWTIERADELAKQGHKIIVWVQQPDHAEMLCNAFKRNTNHDAIAYHGKMPIKKRTCVLNNDFRYGDCPVMFATLGVGERGLNLEQANYELFAVWDWSATVINQAMRRIMRPRQTRVPQFEFAELVGSMDTYQRQMVEMKKAAAGAGLDYGEQDEQAEFLHLDTIIGRFVGSLAEKEGISAFDYIKGLAAA